MHECADYAHKRSGLHIAISSLFWPLFLLDASCLPTVVVPVAMTAGHLRPYPGTARFYGI